MSLSISGIAAFPRLSENNVFYWPQELEKFDGVTVPLRWMHIQTPDAIIGEATFTYDDTDRQVLYTASVTNEDAINEIKKGGYKVSIGASVSEMSTICHRDGECAEAPILDKVEELSIVKDPGLPETSLVINEGLGITMKCDDAIRITSVMESLNTKQVMTDKTVKSECANSEQAPTPIKREVLECPEGWELVDGACVKKVAPVEVPATEAECPEGEELVDGVCKKKAAPATESQKDINVNVNVAKESADKVDIDAIKTEMKAEILDSLGDKFQPKSQVKVAEGKFEGEDEWTVERVKEGLAQGKVTMKLNKEDWIAARTHNTVTEAVSTSGTVPGVKLSADIIVIPGSNTFEPYRSLGQFEAIPTGENTAKFWTMDVQAFGAITESTSTDITASTHTLTAIDVTCATRGILQQVLKSQFEDFPPKFLEKLKEVMRLAAIKDESNLIVQTLASTSNDFNNDTAVLTAGWPAHISGTDGSFVNTTTVEDATGEMQKEGISTARRYLAQRGHDPVNERIVAIISPRAYDNLINDADIARFIQEGNPSITETGLLSRYFGVEIMVSNELLTANNSTRNLVLVVGKAFALASQREMEIEMDKEIAGQYVNIVASHRIGVDELDKTAYVIVSTKQD